MCLPRVKFTYGPTQVFIHFIKDVMLNFLFTFLITINTFAAVSLSEFQQLKDSLHLAFKELRPDSTHRLFINLTNDLPENYWWDLDVVHASYSNLGNNHNIFIFGGFAKLQEMTLDGLAITACHEIAHGIGGAPYKISGTSTEGQADYYATKYCLPKVFKYLNQSSEVTESQFNLNFCKKSSDYTYCMRALTALESNIYFYKTLGDIVYFNTQSDEVATNLNTSPTFYPSSQCRIDTSLRGVIKRSRPACWFPKN